MAIVEADVGGNATHGAVLDYCVSQRRLARLRAAGAPERKARRETCRAAQEALVSSAVGPACKPGFSYKNACGNLSDAVRAHKFPEPGSRSPGAMLAQSS